MAVLFFSFKKQQVVVINNVEKKSAQLEINSTPEKNANDAIDVSASSGTVPQKIPILMYHYIRDYADARDPIGINLSVAPETFLAQLDYLSANNFQTVPLDYLQNPKAVDFRPIILTFDDGYEDAYLAAFPLLEKHNLSGMFYLIVSKIGTPGYLSWDEIRIMQKAGMQFGSHTMTHPNLVSLSDEKLNQEITESKKIIEQNLGENISSFCYPSGKYDARVVTAVKTAGYQSAVTTKSGVAEIKGDQYLLPRLRVTNNLDISKALK